MREREMWVKSLTLCSLAAVVPPSRLNVVLFESVNSKTGRWCVAFQRCIRPIWLEVVPSVRSRTLVDVWACRLAVDDKHRVQCPMIRVLVPRHSRRVIDRHTALSFVHTVARFARAT